MFFTSCDGRGGIQSVRSFDFRTSFHQVLFTWVPKSSQTTPNKRSNKRPPSATNFRKALHHYKRPPSAGNVFFLPTHQHAEVRVVDVAWEKPRRGGSGTTPTVQRHTHKSRRLSNPRVNHHTRLPTGRAHRPESQPHARHTHECKRLSLSLNLSLAHSLSLALSFAHANTRFIHTDTRSILRFSLPSSS